MNNKTWEILYKGKNDDEIVNILLKNRGIKSEKEREEFLNPKPPEKLTLKEVGIKESEVKKAIKRLKLALKNKEKVIVYGDYDADGIDGTAILWESLHRLGFNVLPHIPDRFSEGYGLNAESIKRLKTQDPNLKLIITVDHGIVGNKKIDVAKELGIDVIITDHHEPGKKKPKAFATVHTLKIGGAGVAWIFAREILRNIQHTTYDIRQNLELAAIGTVADQIPLIGPNRSFVKWGLVTLNKTKRKGLLELFRESGIAQGAIGPYEVGFIIAPRINAMGRLTHAIDSLRLLCTKDTIRAMRLARLVNETNLERQKIVEEVVLHARNSKVVKEGVIVLAHESYHEGVIGLAAAKLVEEFYRPAIVLSKKKEISKASARSINGFNIIKAIRAVEGLLVEGGGHPMAAGFSIETSKIDIFIKKLNRIAIPLLTQDLLTKKLKIDLEIPFIALTKKLFDEIELFEPTGLGNPAPVFATLDVSVLSAKTVGREAKHLKLKLEKDGVIFEAIGFGMGQILSELTPDTKVDIAYNLEKDTWNGNEKLQLKIKDLKIRSSSTGV